MGTATLGVYADPDAPSAQVLRIKGFPNGVIYRAVQSGLGVLQQEWVQGEDGDRSSSDGRGSSYFSGERLDQNLSSTASPMHSQQSLTGHLDRASLVTLPARCPFLSMYLWGWSRSWGSEQTEVVPLTQCHQHHG